MRPFLPWTADVDVKLLELIREGWSEDPMSRPTFTVIRNKFSKLYKGQYVFIFK